MLEIFKGTSAFLTDEKGLRRVDLLTRESVDLVFSGRMKILMTALMHAIRVNFADFIPGSPSSDVLPPAASSQ